MARQPWQMTFPNHNNPACDIEPGTEIVLLEPDSELVDMAFEMASPDEQRGDMVYQHNATLNQVRLCLKRVGGREYTFDDLDGDKIDSEFSEFAKTMFIQALNKLTTPEESQVNDFLGSAKPAEPASASESSGSSGEQTGDSEPEPETVSADDVDREDLEAVEVNG